MGAKRPPCQKSVDSKFEGLFWPLWSVSLSLYSNTMSWLLCCFFFFPGSNSGLHTCWVRMSHISAFFVLVVFLIGSLGQPQTMILLPMTSCLSGITAVPPCLDYYFSSLLASNPSLGVARIAGGSHHAQLNQSIMKISFSLCCSPAWPPTCDPPASSGS